MLRPSRKAFPPTDEDYDTDDSIPEEPLPKKIFITKMKSSPIQYETPRKVVIPRIRKSPLFQSINQIYFN